jgi:hypothetical protein
MYVILKPFLLSFQDSWQIFHTKAMNRHFIPLSVKTDAIFIHLLIPLEDNNFTSYWWKTITINKRSILESVKESIESYIKFKSRSIESKESIFFF